VRVFDLVTVEAGKMGGRPCIRGHRFTVEHLVSLVEAGWSLEEIREDFPFIDAEDVRQAMIFASSGK
jgi:uncharacterized protein (DUF433 family)